MGAGIIYAVRPKIMGVAFIEDCCKIVGISFQIVSNAIDKVVLSVSSTIVFQINIISSEGKVVSDRCTSIYGCLSSPESI